MKRKITKKILSFLGILLGLLASATPGYADTFTVDSLKYKTVSATEVSVVGYVPGITHANIPAQVGQGNTIYAVTSIREKAFMDCGSLKSVDIPNSVTSIGVEAFYGCNFTSVDIPNSVTSIGEEAFSMNSLQSAVIGNLITHLNCNIFGDISLKSLTLGENVQKVIDRGSGPNSFLSLCKKIIWLPNTKPEGFTKGVINYVANTSYGEESDDLHILPFLTSIFTVGGVKYVPVPSARTCEAIDCLYGGEPYDVVMDEQVIYKNVPLTITKVNDYAVYRSKLAKSVLINGEFNVGNFAFQGCDSITYINVNAKQIGVSAFENCYNAAYIEAIAQFIDLHAFQSCAKAETINVKAEEIGSGSFGNCSGDVTTDCVIIGPFAFSCVTDLPFQETIKTITFSERTKKIGRAALKKCRGLTTLVIPNSVDTLGIEVFQDCSDLVDVTIGSGIGYLPNNAFAGCRNLPIINIPANVSVIDTHVFDGCTSLATVNIADSDSGLFMAGLTPMFQDCPLDSVYVGGNLECDTSPFCGNTSLRSIKFNDKQTGIHQSGFKGCTNLQNVELGNGIIGIGQHAFWECTALPSIIIPNSVKTIGGYAFKQCSSLTDVTIGSGVKQLKEYTFAGCARLPRIDIPENVMEIKDNVFEGCISLATVNISDRDSVLILGCNSTRPHPMFSSCPLDSVYIGGNISYNQDYDYSPFYGNKSLRSVKFNDKETEITEKEFAGCTNLQNAELGNGIKEIGNDAFAECAVLLSIILPD